jgi:signal transduction histidine kinase
MIRVLRPSWRDGRRPRLPSDHREQRWLALFASTRAIAAATATALLIGHRVTSHDWLLAAVAITYSVGSLVAIVRSRRLQRMPAVWVADGVAVLALVIASAQWRSPFYLLALTTLVLPATALPFRRALIYGAAFTLGYLGVAIATGIDWSTIETTARLETFATHLMVPMIVVLALAYAAQLLERLEQERERSERLAIESERRRIAWELHDSAKQRIHAAHLILSALQREREGPALDQAIREVRSAAADMESSLAELRAPLLDGRGLSDALRARVHELRAATDAEIEVTGKSSALPPFVVAHAYRIASEALTNAVRHAEADRILVRIAHDPNRLSILIEDDGRGVPANPRPGSSGLRSMRNRAHAIGGELAITTGQGQRGTAISLSVPLTQNGAT